MFRGTEYVTEPLPVPWPAVTASHGALLSAVHEHPAPAVTPNVPVPPSLPSVAVAGEIAYVHGMTAASSRTETVCPAIVSVPVRAVVSLFGATVNATTPLPVPFPPLEIESHPASALAVQAHVAPVLTVALPVPPPGWKDVGDAVTL
jgi:hypothetical protein